MNKTFVSAIALCATMAFALPSFAQTGTTEADAAALEAACLTLESSTADNSALPESTDAGTGDEGSDGDDASDSTDGSGTEGVVTVTGTGEVPTAEECAAAGFATSTTTSTDATTTSTDATTTEVPASTDAPASTEAVAGDADAAALEAACLALESSTSDNSALPESTDSGTGDEGSDGDDASDSTDGSGTEGELTVSGTGDAPTAEECAAAGL